MSEEYTKKKSDYLEELKTKVKECHNPYLVKKIEQPNANVQTLFWNDGEITTTKGGWAFMQRSQFTAKSPLSDDPVFEMKDSTDNIIKYAIVKNITVAKEIRELMRLYIECSK